MSFNGTAIVIPPRAADDSPTHKLLCNKLLPRSRLVTNLFLADFGAELQCVGRRSTQVHRYSSLESPIESERGHQQATTIPQLFSNISRNATTLVKQQTFIASEISTPTQHHAIPSRQISSISSTPSLLAIPSKPQKETWPVSLALIPPLITKGNEKKSLSNFMIEEYIENYNCFDSIAHRYIDSNIKGIERTLLRQDSFQSLDSYELNESVGRSSYHREEIPQSTPASLGSYPWSNGWTPRKDYTLT